MIITKLPDEMLLNIIYKLNYIDVLSLYLVNKKLKCFIDKHLYNIYLSFEKNSYELCLYSFKHNVDLQHVFNFKTFSNIYLDALKRKKQSLIIIRYIHKWIVNELLNSAMDRSMVPLSMMKATTVYLLRLYPELEKNILVDDIQLRFRSTSSHRYIKKLIETYVSEDLLNSINISRIIVEGFKLFEKFNFENPKISIYNKSFTSKSDYKIKINKYDTKLFNIY